MEQTPAEREAAEGGGGNAYIVWLMVISTGINLATAVSNAIYGRKHENHQKELLAKVHDNQIDRDNLAHENRELRADKAALAAEMARLKDELEKIRKKP